MTESWEVVRTGWRWRVIRVSDCGVVAGVPTRPFRTVERAYWRHDKALAYALSRRFSAAVHVHNGELSS